MNILNLLQNSLQSANVYFLFVPTFCSISMLLLAKTFVEILMRKTNENKVRRKSFEFRIFIRKMRLFAFVIRLNFQKLMEMTEY